MIGNGTLCLAHDVFSKILDGGFGMKFVIVVLFLLTVVSSGCESENASEVTLPTEAEVNGTSNEIATDPTPEPEIIAEVAEEPGDELAGENLCKVGDLLNPGDSCIDPSTGEQFEVLGDGRGKFVFVVAGKGIDLRGNINGKLHNFAAERLEGDTWKITRVTPE